MEEERAIPTTILSLALAKDWSFDLFVGIEVPADAGV